MAGIFRSFTLTARRAMQAIGFARRHGWSEDPFVAPAYQALAGAVLWQGRVDEAETWLEHAERLLPGDDRPARGLLHASRGSLERARGREQAALASYQAAERLSELVVTPWLLGNWTRVQILITTLQLQGADAAEQALARMDRSERDTAEARAFEAELKVARGDPEAATIMLSPVLAGELHVSVNTVKAHARHLYAKLGSHSRGEAVERARALRLLAPSARPHGTSA